MGNYLNPGNTGFAEIRNDTYVDKSGLISLINQTIDTPRRLTCISRPRRFGKSFTAQMLCAYYDKTCDSSVLFDDLAISADKRYPAYRNCYDVIYLDMTGIIGETSINEMIPFIRRNIIRELKEAYPELEVVESFVSTLLRAVELAGNKFFMIIDEWDAPIREAKKNSGAQQKYLEFLRSLFKNSGATSKIFSAVYMTGILPIKKDGSQSAISDFKEFSVLDPGGFAEFTGFTESEVQKLCAENQMSFDDAKSWYDGYSFGDFQSIYNPYSVMSAIQSRKFKSYWRKTSAAEALLTYIDMDEEGLQEDIARLISGESIEITVDGYENDFETFRNKDDVLTLMVHLGYLAYTEAEQGQGNVKIPNEEVRIEFRQALRKGHHAELLQLVQESDWLLAKTLEGDANAVANAIARVHDSNYAPTYYNDEQALRATVRYAYLTCVDQYLKIEELPSGHGCADIVYLPKKRSPLPAMIIELKWNKTASGAIAQIKERNYPAALRNYGGELLLVGINYNAKTKEHTCKIERLYM